MILIFTESMAHAHSIELSSASSHTRSGDCRTMANVRIYNTRFVEKDFLNDFGAKKLFASYGT
jgi:hypothetical protein